MLLQTMGANGQAKEPMFAALFFHTNRESELEKLAKVKNLQRQQLFSSNHTVHYEFDRLL